MFAVALPQLLLAVTVYVPVAAPATVTFGLVLSGLNVPVPVQEYVGAGLPVAVASSVSELPAQIGLLLLVAVISGTVQNSNW
ncbi:MAG TPA: hypothetical protein P5291_10265, partial [Flavobacteriales bacterium]|nr:hypothetical protein [Flavobacteriales bacterium]